MLRRCSLTSSSILVTTSVAARTASTYRVTRGTESIDRSKAYLDNLTVGQRRYDLMGPRSLTHTRRNIMSPKQKAKILPNDDLTGKTAVEPVRYIDDPKNWPELMKQDWEDYDKNDKKLWVQPRGFF
eukprot:GILI01012509.1.p1 GENE.GILI01012509.1~~GILI01012509.1.p1  ORF type:complete len:127 (+),score=14.92 GILI01012509.1:45-425(+)